MRSGAVHSLQTHSPQKPRDFFSMRRHTWKKPGRLYTILAAFRRRRWKSRQSVKYYTVHYRRLPRGSRPQRVRRDLPHRETDTRRGFNGYHRVIFTRVAPKVRPSATNTTLCPVTHVTRGESAIAREADWNTIIMYTITEIGAPGRCGESLAFALCVKQFCVLRFYVLAAAAVTCHETRPRPQNVSIAAERPHLPDTPFYTEEPPKYGPGHPQYDTIHLYNSVVGNDSSLLHCFENNDCFSRFVMSIV